MEKFFREFMIVFERILLFLLLLLGKIVLEGELGKGVGVVGGEGMNGNGVLENVLMEDDEEVMRILLEMVVMMVIDLF